MRGRTPLADDTPKRAPLTPPRDTEPVNITCGRGSCTEEKIVPYFSSPTAPTRMITSTSSVDEHLINQSQQNYPVNHRQHQGKQQEVAGAYYRTKQTAQDKRSRLSNVINSLYRKVPVNDRNSVEKNLETLEKYVMTVLNGVIKDAETEGTAEKHRKSNDSCYNGPNVESRIITDDGKPLNELSSEPTAVEPAVPNVTISQNSASENKEEEQIQSVEIACKLKDSTELVVNTVPSSSLNTDEITAKLKNEPTKCEKIQTICRDLLNELVSEISQAIDVEPVNTSLQCSLPLEKVAPVLEYCDTSPNLCKSTVRHLCLYCDRKFLSISLRQRHTERVHQLGGGRRSARNTRSTNCQYCSEKYAENLEDLFQHMIDSHSDKYHGCLQCSTRYSTRDALLSHTNVLHPKEEKDTPEFKKTEQVKKVKRSQLKMFTPIKLNILPRSSSDLREPSTSQDFDSSFYSNVSGNIRENLLHHLDGKLCHNNSSNSMIVQPCQQQNFHEPMTQIQFPIDISLTAATPGYNHKEYSINDESENSSEYAQKPGKISSSHPRRISFEKYNFPKKYDGKEQWNCSIRDLCEFDITAQLTMRKKQDLSNEKLPLVETKHTTTTKVSNTELITGNSEINSENTSNVVTENKRVNFGTQFTVEFGNFIRLRRWDECPPEAPKNEEIVYAELTGEWSRPRVYICGACFSKHKSLKDVEDHKLVSHPNVWCSHLEFSGDQTELDKHLVLLGRGAATMNAKNAILHEKVCTKCSKICATLSELHKHMLECGGDQTWLLGLFGNGKKKCKWRPFGSRRRRQRGMKRNIQNSQNSQNQVNRTPREKQPSTPRVRPSDRESIEKMLANLPAKRSTRRARQEINLRSQARLSKIQTRSKQRKTENISNSRLSRKAVLRNKLIKNAKSFQRKRCRGDNISAAIESVITNYDINIKKHNVNDSIKEDSGIKNLQSIHRPGKILKDTRIARKRKNLKIQEITSNNIKSLKNRKNSTIKLAAPASKINKSNMHNTKSRKTEILPTIKRKKSSESVISSASIKAKSQLRTNDGKFARNSIKHDETLSDNTNSHSSSQSSGTQFTRSNVTRSATRSQQQENLNVTLSRRITRVSCDVDKMPTLELADKLTSRQIEPGKLSNELPILSPVLKVPPVASSELDKSSITETIPIIPKKRGRRKKMVKNNEKISQNIVVNPPESLENVSIIQTRTRKSYQCQKLENEKANVSDPSISVDECDSSNKNANSEEKSTATTKKNKPRIRGRMTKTKPNKEQSSESLIEKLPESVETEEKNTSNLQVKSSTKKQTVKQSKKKIVRTASSAVGTKIMRGKRQLWRQRGRTDKNIEQDTSATRKSPRTLDKKSLSNNFIPSLLSTTLPQNLIDTPLETRESVNEEQDKKEENIELIDAEAVVKEHVEEIEKVKNVPESIEELPEALSKENDETEPLDAKIASPIDNEEQEINQHEDENSPVIEKQSIEIVCDLVNLSFEHLQQESSNSNIDSGKENSSETPINITKSKVPRPKKSRGFRRDRGPGKRTLNNVIGILTEGVNIPIEVQQSVVLTVQTSIESLNAQSHSSNTQNEANRVELEYNNVASGATNSATSNPDEDATENVIVDSAVNYEHGDGDSQKVATTKETADPETTVSQINSQSTELLPSTNDSINNAQTVTNTTENDFSNDIILDLSRRKQNGKGSFLEKIVSKIAKQKDVLLDNEVGSLLDHAVDELSIILASVGSKMPFDSENEAQSRMNQKNDNEPSKSQGFVVENEDVTSINKKLLNENEIERIEEDNKISDAGEHNPATLPSDLVDNKVEGQTINSDESKEFERVSKKRSADITLPITNKRKTINEEEKIETKIDDELYLSDIMKLINSTPKVAQSPVMCSNTEQEEIRMGKRKITKGKADDSTENLSEEMIEFDCSATTTSKKLRKNQRDLVRAEKKSNVSSRGRRSRHGRHINDSVNSVIETKESEIDENDKKMGDENSIDIEKREKSFETTTNSHKLKIEESEASSSGNFNNSKEAPIQEASTEEMKNGKDLVNEILPIVISQEHETPGKKSWIDEELPSLKATRKSKEIVTSKEKNNSETVDSSKLNCYTSNQFIGLEKPNEMTIPVNSCTDAQNLQVPLTLLSKSAIEDKSTTPKEQKCSRRKNNNRKVDTPNVEGASIERQNNTLVQRRQTLKRKAKENIFLIEELLDFGDDIDIPLEITKKEDSKKEENKVIEETELQPIKELAQTGITTQEPKDEEKKIIEDLPKVNSEIIDETHTDVPINKVEPIAGEPAIDDDTLNLKKRASGNFAVVHTKSGEILIVEKKKKFTKEAARFFCDVCATSFTRKSSLKKHNISQSHILQVSKFSNEQESATLTETVPLEFSTLTNPLLPPENSLNGKVLEEKANEKEEKKEEEEKEEEEIPLVSADSKIDTLEAPDATHTGTDPFNSQLEEELLDEEICKITENMTHDEYVITDHVSPEGGLDIPTPEKAVNVIPKVLESPKSKEYKINLADEHLELESPPVPTKSKDESQTITLCPENILSSPNPNISLDFSNITEKLNGNKPFLQNERLDTITMELNKDKNVQPKQDNIIDEEKIVSFIPKEDQIDFKSSRLSKKSCKSTDSEKSTKKTKTHNKRSKKKCQVESRESESEVESDRENIKSRNKNKIVKSVFGRAFAGEKLDKVMEVLDDWNSKSENESQDESFLNTFQPLSKEEKIDRKGRVNKLDESNSLSLESNSRCRQSKKRAEERISRTFEEDSIPYELKFETLEKKEISHDKASSYDKELHLDNSESVESKRESNLQKSQESYYMPERKKEENSSLIDSFSDNSKLKIIIAEEPSLPDTNSMESIHTRVPSCPRERSSTPDLISVTTRDSDNEAEEFATDINDEDDEDEEQLSVRGRLSPFYASNAPESSINSGTMSTSNHINNTEDFMESRRAEFSGEKIVTRSPVLSSQESCPGVVTIAPTDAIEDNALDVPQEIQEMKEKSYTSRQGKVLNFDEELFVECCSRLKATTENELRGAKKIKLNQTDDYETTEQSCQGVRPISDRWRDVESQNSLGSLLESVNQLLGEEMYNSRRAEESHKRRNEIRETASPIRIVQNDSIRPDNVSYEDSLDVAFEHNNKLRDKIQQRMRESENMIAASFGQNTTNNGKNYKNYYDTRHEENPITGKIESEGDTFNTSVNYSSKHIPLEPLGVNNKINPTMDGFLDKALSNLLHQNGKHDHNGSTPMKVLAELACVQVPASTTKSDTKTAFEKLSSNSHKTEKEVPKKCRNPIKELFERKKELNDRKKEPTNTVKQKSKKIKHQDESPLIRKSQFGVGLVERKKRHINYEKKLEKPAVIRTKDVYEFDDEDSPVETKFTSPKTSYRSHSEKLTEPATKHSVSKESREINVCELMSRTITKTLDNGKTTESSGKRLNTMIERKLQESEAFIPKTKGALKSYHIEEKQQRGKHVTGPMDNYVERKRNHRSKRLSETSGKTLKAKKKSKNSKKRSRHAWYEDDSSDEFVTAFKADSVGVGITKSQRTCSKGKQNLFAELSSTSSESEYEELRNDKEETKDSKIKEWIDEVAAETENVIDDSEKIESDHPLVIDEKESERPENSDDEDDDDRSGQAFELDDLYREDSSDATSDFEAEKEVPEMNFQRADDKDSGGNDLIPLDEALVLLDNPENAEKEESLDKIHENHEEIPPTVHSNVEDLPEKLSSDEKPPKKAPDNLPLHVFLSRKVQESKKKKEEKLKKLKEEKEREKKKKQEELEAVEENDKDSEQTVEYQSTRRQRKCAIGKQGLLAEISSSDEEYYYRDIDRRSPDKSDYEKSRRQKRESKEKRKERDIEKKHELIIAKEQKAIEEEILRELKMKKPNEPKKKESDENFEYINRSSSSSKSNKKQRSKNLVNEAKVGDKNEKKLTNSDTENKCNKLDKKTSADSFKRKEEQSRHSLSSKKNDKKAVESTPETNKRKIKKSANHKKTNSVNGESSNSRNSKDRKSTNAKRDTDDDDEELKTTKSWNRVDEGVGVAIGRRKRAAANQLYYWSSSTDEDEELVQVTPVVEEEDDRQEQHGWIVGDSHKKMITMLAMEKQLKEKRRRSEDEFESGKTKNKKYRNSTS